ncbi:MAG: YlmC/YmxH family sporulation protein [Ruminococcus sp.]|nr:YlmC/YmxH family sporulation protein [Ruminococcus sp.]
MICTLAELRQKDVINVENGENLGRIDDLNIDSKTAAVVALILYRRPRYFGWFGEREDCIIRFSQIQLIGKDVILVTLPDTENCSNCKKKSERIIKKFMG